MKKYFIIILFCIVGIKATAQQYAIQYFNFSSQQQDLKMAFVYEKTASANAKTIVLLHGKNFSGTYWYNTAAQLLKSGYNVLIPDQIGFGHSSLPQQYQFTFQQLALNTYQLLDSLDIKKAIVLGHSIGGMLATRFALMYPQVCEQLILEDPIGLEDWKLTVPYASIDEQFKKELMQTKEGLKKYMTDNYFHGEWKNSYDELLEQSSKNLGKKEFAWDMALTSDMLYTQPVYYELSTIKVPVVLIVGDLDKTAPGKERATKEEAAKLGDYKKIAQEAASTIPNCKLVIVEDIGHIPHIENFELFINRLDDVLIKK